MSEKLVPAQELPPAEGLAPAERLAPGEKLAPTPSHTVGPFYGYALPFPGGGEMAPAGHPGAITLHGYVRDGEGAPVPDALVELWQAGPDGSLAGAGGSMRRDPVTGGFLGRNGVDFTGFGRIATDADGHWTARTLPPGGPAAPAAPYISVCVHARGLLHHLFTRVYFPGNAEANAADPLLASLDPARRETLVATAASPPGTYRFDIRLQGEGETVFLEFR
ncbi:protocatechuate 3,4-dioxygenase subunit alpha [Streptomyces rapamycinicus]|uniref:Protocatechuate 4,5-dioxygenase subunit alpha n=2 Tax=Streptomyces rapamycinicus TaxID=1226757 RepID=A0A0A0NTG5_STRRN|nr:protocatechuate 3,4-dioxygenase subunit alpha [Streptomyces rapamycinicus]AGP57995.1 protocatechuate 4,5-dioxygenase subunit alpha [Streptomyces rapamycinicus NRRL 5491]MBB4785667.1 protocatechuate 3,4-dioxygenase alpha subunit [Streptomyces rapamycinicus]RLV78868.1 protocatechuate 4,5-dioxygenase subunit alpha [Streptomyces rapamycinicus NRRL 5491]UTO65833.1 protocatechuate 3,4-dioxygenase subunit alpha [Streptomyces rapamycinicus]UTP33788.1 protocatechuate 3,4-dioxygenase subunit alpha [S